MARWGLLRGRGVASRRASLGETRLRTNAFLWRGLTLKTFLYEFWLFGIKQASACVFGAYLLSLILLTEVWYPTDCPLYRNDFLFLAAVGFQVVLLTLRLESLREAAVILVFHVVATVMEVFKTSDAIGAWHYPGEFHIGIGNVPLFAGFMYSAVGSYIARVWRIFDFQFTHYPPPWTTWILVALIYINFFTHHYTIDIRNGLLLASVVLYGRCRVHFCMDKVHRHMPVIIGWFLVALFIWFAENIATFAGVWLYPHQRDEWTMVSPTKLIAWYLLMLLSFVMVALLHRSDDEDTT
jgi:uncharacterized membrane protein YoaT (DUF817 family)